MTYSEIMAMLTEIGLPFAYDHFAEGESPGLPYIVFLFPGTDNFMADDVVYFGITEVAIELYTDFKSPPDEKKVENVLNAYEIPWDKTEVWIEDVKLYEVRYEFDTPLDWDEDDPDDESDEDEDNNTQGG